MSLVAAVTALSASTAHAAVITVGGACLLNGAIAAANADAPAGACPAGSGADTIVLTDDVQLTSVADTTDGTNGLLSITSVVVIEGNGVTIVRAKGAPAFRIFHVGIGGNLTLRNLTIGYGVQVETAEQGAFGGCIYHEGNRLELENVGVGLCGVIADVDSSSQANGGAIYSRGRLFLDRSVVFSSFASGQAAAYGGAISALNSFELSRSTLRDNLAQGAIARGGAVYSFLTADPENARTVVESTLSGNDAVSTGTWSEGGAIANGQIQTTPLIEVSNSTFSENTATCTGGSCGSPSPTLNLATVSHSTFSGNVGSVTLEDSSVRGSIFHDSSGNHCLDVVDLGGGNIADDTTCGVTIAGTLTGFDPTLKDNGGPTATHALTAGSTAIDLSGSCGLATDQRGVARQGSCDAGAYEWKGCAPSVIRDLEITGFSTATNCHTIWLGPNLTVTGTAFVSYAAGARFVLRNGVRVESGGEMILGINPMLLP